VEPRFVSRPLAGIRVLDLSRVLAGPWATQLLADLGAEVIKVEKPGAGDDTRHWGPPWHGEGDERVAAYFLAANRGKRSVAIDFATEEGAALVRSMAADADVLVENFKVGGLKRFGLDAASLRAAHPRLVYASITGFGQDGPYAQRAGYDYIIQAMGGLMSLTGLPDGEPGGGPMRVGVAVADLFTGMYTANAILAALVRRAETGAGATVDMALFDTQLAMLANQASNALVSGKDPVRQGVGHPNIVPYQPFMAADQPLIVAVGNDGQFRKLAAILGQAGWADDERFANNASRVANRDTLVPAVARIIATRPAAEWQAQFEAAGIPSGPINNISQALADPQAVHRGMRLDVDGTPMIGSPIRLDGERQDAPLPPPALGADGDLLSEWLDADALAALRAKGIVG
jgi:crotonobetainyl-CoA:carnitine CoA-transferase CaiB-like acyl-CoA transferase